MHHHNREHCMPEIRRIDIGRVSNKYYIWYVLIRVWHPYMKYLGYIAFNWTQRRTTSNLISWVGYAGNREVKWLGPTIKLKLAQIWRNLHRGGELWRTMAQSAPCANYTSSLIFRWVLRGLHNYVHCPFLTKNKTTPCALCAICCSLAYRCIFQTRFLSYFSLVSLPLLRN